MQTFQAQGGLGVISDDSSMKDFLQERHDLRLESLHVCDDSELVTPCRRGDIIIEGMTGNKTEVWQQGE